MDAITKKWLSDDKIIKMYQNAIKKQVVPDKIVKLSGGFCSAVYLLTGGEEKVVLKVGTDTDVKVMRHEKMYLPVEAEMMKILNENTNILMPRLVFYDDSLTLCDVPYFFMSYIDGSPLMECSDISEEERHDIKRQIGIITKKICEMKADTFGIPMIPESYRNTNYEFVFLLFSWLLEDAKEKQIDIPGITAKELLGLIEKCKESLNQAVDPRYIHTDTWDGNVMVKDGKFVGLIDFAAILYGDPLMSHDFHDFGEVPDPFFLQGYGKSDFSEDEKIRIQVYRIWQRLGMVVERGYRDYEDKNLYSWVLYEFTKEIEILKQWV